MQAWIGVFLVVIALNAVVQAGLVFALFFGMRLLNRNLDRLEAHVDQEVRPRIEELAGVAARLASAAEAARAQSIRLDTAFTSRVGGLQRRLDRTLGRFGEAAQHAADRMGGVEGSRSSRAWPSALFTGLLRGLATWRDSRPDDDEPESDERARRRAARPPSAQP